VREATALPPVHITALIPAVALLLVLGTDAWVYKDAQDRLRQGHRVSVSVGSFQIQTPQAWFLGCLILWVVFFPLYLSATGRNPFAHSNV
jgi:cytochrome c oxidase assembly factor CtaG